MDGCAGVSNVVGGGCGNVLMSAYLPIGMMMSLLTNRPPPRLRVLYEAEKRDYVVAIMGEGSSTIS